MSDQPTSSPEPRPTPTGGAIVVETGDAADRYVASELQRERASLRISMIVSALTLLFVGGYLWYITSTFKSNLEPEHAADIAKGIMMQQIQDNGPEFVRQVKEQVPAYIEKTPDYVLAELPKYRQQIADKVEKDLKDYCDKTSADLTKHLDSVMDEHKDHVKGLLDSANDPTQVKQVGEDMKQALTSYIKDKPASGESIGSQIDQALTSLRDVQKRVHRLATAKDLTPQEKKARHAIAVLTQGIDAHKEIQMMSPGQSLTPSSQPGDTETPAPVPMGGAVPPVKPASPNGKAPQPAMPSTGTTAQPMTAPMQAPPSGKPLQPMQAAPTNATAPSAGKAK